MNSIQKQGKHTETATQVDPMILWNGWSGQVEIAGMRFEVEKKKMPDGQLVKVVKVRAAAGGTKLYGLGGSDVYVTVTQLHFGEFQSRLREGSSKWLEQKRIWDFLHSVFVAAGIKTKPQPKPAAVSGPTQPKLEIVTSIKDFMFGVLGVYCFDKQAPRAFFQVRGARTSTVKSLVVDLVSVEHGHPLCNYCRPGTYLFLDDITRDRTPDFKGAYAGDCQKAWEFLTDLMVEYQRPSAAATQPRPCSTTVDYHGNA